ncbi:hypothetical protein PZA22_13035 [Pectobacterium polaris]|uniref:hypothetical protein n=1 Tax=Pectobacterium polaris TaxID=2042057 RepID=UPI000E7555A3|nr:hypothetical protein [Pectobacterium polaris]MDE8755406.1 hypothetical protein [Pectobacterium polaris]RJL31492.1 hypothetical protein D5074_00430 [Pectobacterium polaris]
MALLSQSDLKYTYSWTALGNDDPKKTGKPDSTLLNRHEGYEVLPFINRFAEKHSLKNKAIGLKVEKMIRENLPGDVRSHKNVIAWLENNWNSY